MKKINNNILKDWSRKTKPKNTRQKIKLENQQPSYRKKNIHKITHVLLLVLYILFK